MADDDDDSQHELSRLENINSLGPRQWEHSQNSQELQERKMLEHLEINRNKRSKKSGGKLTEG